MGSAGDFQLNIRNFNASGCSFTDVRGNLNNNHHCHVHGNHINHGPELERGKPLSRRVGRTALMLGALGIKKLSKVVSLNAIHDSSERHPPPKCHPETRILVLDLISRWIEDPNSTSSVLWLYGPAGVGKSAILQSLAEKYCLLERLFGASFFFSRGKPGRDQGHFLFSTIAYQLALNLPYLRTPIDSAMQANPTLDTKSMTVQMRSLIIDSFRKLSENIEHTPTIIVDGLDECDDHKIQTCILEIIYEAVAIHKIPLRFLIASRPESHIQKAFDQPKLRSITKRIALDESFNPSRDIEIYLRTGFEGIREQNSSLMAHVVPQWPEPKVLNFLVQKASGQFVYASTVLNFVGAEGCDPISQLDILLQPSPSNGTLFSSLDDLYSQILSTYPLPSREKLICVLGTILAIDSPQPPVVIGDLLGMNAAEVELVLCRLHSLIKFPDIRSENFKKYTGVGENRCKEYGIRLLHASFHDYLVDESRSSHFFIDTNVFRAQITKAGFLLMAKWISRPWR